MATKIIYNCNIWTGDSSNPHGTAIAIANTSILSVGDYDSMASLKNENTVLINANGAFVCPSFIDSHIHFIMGGSRLTSVQLAGCASAAEFIDRIAAFALTLEEGILINL